MKNFLSDLWHDLREKRLWPVAVLLLAALVAVPVVLSKPSETPAPAPAPTEARTAPEPKDLKELASVKLDTSAAGTGSSLDTFDPSNPFRPPRSVMRNGQQTQTDSGPQSDSTAGDSSPAPSGGTSLDVGGDLVIGGGDPGGDTGGGDTGGGDTGGGDTDGGGTPTKTVQYAYVIDVTFEANGRKRRIKSMDRLDMLPNADSPLLLFLGVTASGGDAVFLVDSTLDAAGEGQCKPSGEDCSFLHLGPGSEHAFTNDEGDSYVLKVDEIRKVRVDTKRDARSSKKHRTANAALGAPPAARRFVPPFLADLVSVSSATAGASDTNQDRR
jgi:hypothetical protein